MSVQATARGTLGATPLSNLLVYGLDRALTGTLVIEDSGGRKCGICFKGGAPRKVRLSEPVERLGDMLVAAGLADRESVAAAFDASRASRILHGKALLDRGLVDAETLDSTLAEQLIRKLEWMTSLGPESVFGYYDGVDFLEAYAGRGVVVDPLEVIQRVIHRTAELGNVDAVLGRLANTTIRLHPSSRVGRFGFGARERGLLDVIRMKPQPLADLLSSGLLAVPDMKRVLYTLAVTRHLDLGGNARPLGVDSPTALQAPASTSAPPRVASPSPGSQVAPPPPTSIRLASIPAPAPGELPLPPGGGAGSSRSPASAPYRETQATLPPQFEARASEELAFRSEILETAERLGTLDHYRVLGLEPGTPVSAVQAAFFQLAKKWHPDRLGPGLADVRDAAGRVFARMSEAHQVLSNDAQRAEYERTRSSGVVEDAEQAVVQRVLAAATAFQKAEVLLRRGQLEAAASELRFAVENDPDQAEYRALHADLLSQGLERQAGSDFAPVLQMVNEARKREPQNLRVRVYRARVLKRAGDMEGAVKEWKGIVEQEPSNVEAGRELRLYEMRRGKKPTDTKADDLAGSGKEIGQFFGKLFKR